MAKEDKAKVLRWEEIPVEKRVKMTSKELAEARGIPHDKFVNAGNAPIVMPQRTGESAGGSQRLEPGDIVEGAYYEQMLGKAQGLMRMCLVDDKRLAVLDKMRRIRHKEEYPDWIKEAKAIQAGAEKPKDPVETLMGSSPLDRFAEAQNVARPHAGDEKTR